MNLEVGSVYGKIQVITMLGKNTWAVARLIELSRDFPVYEVPIMALGIYKIYEVNMREFVMHMKAVLAADLSYPIILDYGG